MSQNTPAHPGTMIKKNIIEAKGLNVSSAAKILKVGRQALSAMVNGRADLSLEMALRIEKAFGVNADLLAKMQLAYDMALLRTQEDKLGVEMFNK